MRNAFLALFLIPLCLNASRADLLTLTAPLQYTPGTSFTVDVGLAPIPDPGLGLYNVDVLFEWTGAGTLTVDSPAASGTGYVFASDANFLAATDASPQQLRVTLSDFILDPTGPNVVAGVNDRLSSLLLHPSADLGSSVAVSFDRTSLFLDDADGNGLMTGGPLPTASVSPNAVPAPAGAICAAVGVGLLALRRRRTRSRAPAAG